MHASDLLLRVESDLRVDLLSDARLDVADVLGQQGDVSAGRLQPEAGVHVCQQLLRLAEGLHRCGRVRSSQRCNQSTHQGALMQETTYETSCDINSVTCNI